MLSDHLYKYTTVIYICLYIKIAAVLHEIIVTECSTYNGILFNEQQNNKMTVKWNFGWPPIWHIHQKMWCFVCKTSDWKCGKLQRIIKIRSLQWTKKMYAEVTATVFRERSPNNKTKLRHCDYRTWRNHKNKEIQSMQYKVL